MAAEPPETKSPPAVAGRPQICRSQSTVTSSTSAGPAPANQVPTKGFQPAARASAMALTKLPGAGTKAKKRGWETAMARGSTSRSSRARTSSTARGSSGIGSARARSRLARSAQPATGCSASVAVRSTRRSTTR